MLIINFLIRADSSVHPKLILKKQEQDVSKNERSGQKRFEKYEKKIRQRE